MLVSMTKVVWKNGLGSLTSDPVSYNHTAQPEEITPF